MFHPFREKKILLEVLQKYLSDCLTEIILNYDIQQCPRCSKIFTRKNTCPQLSCRLLEKNLVLSSTEKRKLYAMAEKPSTWELRYGNAFVQIHYRRSDQTAEDDFVGQRYFKWNKYFVFIDGKNALLACSLEQDVARRLPHAVIGACTHIG